MDTVLTQRQNEVMLLTCRGKSAKEIAKEIHISPRTAEEHRSESIRRLGAKNLIQAVAIFASSHPVTA